MIIRARSEIKTRWADWLRHTGCILALMWVPLVNGQPFFFPDTTAYVRAGDLVATLATGGRAHTVWSDRYDAAHTDSNSKSARSTTGVQTDVPVAGGNDLRAGNIMAGRSPYFGFLLYLGFAIGRFWPFVLAQAACAYALIVLSLRHFGLNRTRTVVTIVGGLAASMCLPFYDGLLLADALAAFGIVAFLLLATDRGELRLGERLFLAAVLLTSVMSHMTHIVMLAAMFGLLVLLTIIRVAPRLSGQALLIGAGGLVLGLGSVWLTSVAVRQVFDKPPQLPPLLTARFIVDGPGTDFIRSGCGGHAFVACEHVPNTRNSDVYLWSYDPDQGGYLARDPATRMEMGAQDTAFALAVLRAYPVRTLSAMARDTALQLVTFPLTGLNEGCFAAPDCWSSLPKSVRDRLRASPAGRNLWPVRALNVLLYVVVAASTAALLLLGPALRRTEAGRQLLLWIALAAGAMLANAFFGGAVSSPQWRYQGRLIWLMPFLAMIAVALWRRRDAAVPDPRS